MARAPERPEGAAEDGGSELTNKVLSGRFPGANNLAHAGRLIVLLAFLSAAAVICLVVIADSLRASEIQQRGIERNAAAALLTANAPPAVMLAAAERLDPEDGSAVQLARDLTRRALSRNRHQPLGWASLAHFETRLSGAPNEAALNAFQVSLRQCAYCDRDLLRWRLGYVLRYWDDIPEDIRLEVFRGGDFLRWWHLDNRFLAEARQLAEAQGIPFTDYQREVGTSVRPRELPR